MTKFQGGRLGLSVLAGLAVLAMIATGGWLALPLWPANIPEGGVSVSVRQGSSLSRLATDLQRLELAPAIVVHAVARIRGSARRLRAGEYLFEAPQTIADILSAIESGSAKQLAITVVEGSRLSDLYAQLSTAAPSGGAATFAAGSLPARTSLGTVLGKDQGLEKHAHGDLEGYFFPDTYFVAPGSSAIALLDVMHRRMKDE